MDKLTAAEELLADELTAVYFMKQSLAHESERRASVRWKASVDRATQAVRRNQAVVAKLYREGEDITRAVEHLDVRVGHLWMLQMQMAFQEECEFELGRNPGANMPPRPESIVANEEPDVGTS